MKKIQHKSTIDEKRLNKYKNKIDQEYESLAKDTIGAILLDLKNIDNP